MDAPFWVEPCAFNVANRDNCDGTKQAAAEAGHVTACAHWACAAAAKRTCRRAAHLAKQTHYFAVSGKQNAGKAAAGDAAGCGEDCDGSADVVTQAVKKMISPKIHKSFLLYFF